MRKSLGAVALIARQSQGRKEWLAQWNKHWNSFNFVAGHKLPHESFRECVIRELLEELSIAEQRDYLVGDSPLARLEYIAFSRSAREQTAYTVELFEVSLLGRQVEEKVEATPTNRWLAEDEIAMKKTSQGAAVSETMSLLLDKARLWTSPPDRPGPA
jgi:8-oxo-dGTP pyrophosphatase MutT (NUDIX family)